jgi:hypothetical protein
MKMMHYLITVDRLHAYLMTNDKEDIKMVADKMLDFLKDETFIPLILATRLSTAIDMVRKIIISRHPEAERVMADATNFHCTIFTVQDPVHEHLMALH